MCASKSPISALQEYTMTRRLPLPYYQISHLNSGFKCTVVIGEIESTAVASNKKFAKHLCAERALHSILPNYSDNNNSFKLQSNAHEEPFVNSVGKLNEMCSQNGVAFPSYIEEGIVDQKFVIQCKLFSYATQGIAATKKQAKQNAAKEMLESVQSTNFWRDLQSQDIKQYSSCAPEIENKIIDIFKQLSTIKQKDKLSGDNVTTATGTENESANVKKSLYGNGNFDFLIKNSNVSREDLKANLQRLNVAYKIVILQSTPLTVLSLQTIVSPSFPNSYTFIATRESYEEAECEVLKDALNNINILIK